MSSFETPGTDVPGRFIPSGDAGSARFGAHGDVAKHDELLDAYGQCAEANASIGAAIAVGQLPVEVNTLLTSVQNDMLDLAADLSVPLDAPEPAEARISAAHLRRLERAVRYYSEDIADPGSRVLPGGTAAAALLYLARNVVRRAERAVWRAVAGRPEAVNPNTGKYLNRLSTLLLLLARVANLEHGNLRWDPGASERAMGGHGTGAPS